MGDGGGIFCCAAVSCGLLFLTIGLIMAAVGPAQEADLWYSLTLCPTNTPKTFISQQLTASQACIFRDNLNVSRVETETFEVSAEAFGRDTSRSFSPVIMRIGDGEIDLTLKDKSGSVLFATGPLTLTSVQSDVATAGKRSAPEEEMHVGERKLLKAGGGGGGGSGRSRSGSSARWGGTTYYSRGYYGYYAGGAVAAATVVYVYRPGPPMNRGYYSTSEDHPSCTDVEKGCEYEIAYSLDRDELSNFQFEFPDKDVEEIFPLTLESTLTATAPAVSAATNNQEVDPQFYITFYTEQKLTTEIVGIYFFVIVGCILVFPGSLVAYFIGDKFM